MTTPADGHAVPARSAAAEKIKARAELVAKSAVERARAAAGEAGVDPEDTQKAKRARRAAAKADAIVREADWTIANAEELAAAREATLRRGRDARRARAPSAKREPAVPAEPLHLALVEARPPRPTTTSLEDADRGLFGRGAPRPIARRS